MRTFKRKILDIDTSINNISKYNNQLTFTGIKQSKNIYEVDQKSQIDTLNVYVNDENTLVSREPLVEDTIDIELDGELIDIKETNGVKVYVTETETNYKIIAKRDNEIIELTATEYHLAIFNQYIICFRTEGARVIDTNKDTLVWSDFSTVTADIISKVIIGPDVEKHDINQFTDGYIERYIRTHDIQTVLPMDTSAITTYTVKTATVTIKDIAIDEPWRYPKERLFKPVYSIDEDLVRSGNSILAANNIIIIPMDEYFMLSYDYGTTFVQVAYPFIEAGVAAPSLSEDGKCFFYISDRLYRFTIDNQQWISYSMYNADGSELKLDYVYLAKFVDSENFIFASERNIYVKSLNLSYDGYNNNELIAIPLESEPTLKSIYMKADGNNTTCGIIMYSSLGDKEYCDYYLYQIFGNASNALIINKQLLNLSGLSSYNLENQVDIDNITGENISGSKNWSLTTDFSSNSEITDSRYIWTDGFDYYYNYSGTSTTSYKWNKSTKQWEYYEWYNNSGVRTYDIDGKYIWRGDGNIYCNNLLLNTGTMRWTAIDKSIGTNNYSAQYLKQFGENNYVYYSSGNTHKIKRGRNESWDDMAWLLNGSVSNISMESIDFWTDGKNLYYSKSGTSGVNYKLVPSSNSNTGTIEAISWTGLTNISGREVYHINGETYYHNYRLNSSTNTWESVLGNYQDGQYIREVDNNYYCCLSDDEVYKLDYNYSALVTLRYVSDRSSSKFTYKKNILTIEKNNVSSTTDEQIFATDNGYIGQITKLNDDNYIWHTNITTDKTLGNVYGNYKLYDIPSVTNTQIASIEYIPVSEGLYIITSDGENYNILSNILVDGDRFEVDYKYGSTSGYYDKVPTLSYSGSELFLVFNNELRITKNEKVGTDIKFNLPEINNQSFANKITNLINISTTELALFFEDNVQICTKSTSDIGEVYSYSKTRLSLGVRYGDDVINTLDGANSIFPTIRGLALMNYQAYMATTDQMLTFISDDITELWNSFYDKSTNIKIVQMRNYIYMSNGTNEYLMFDTRTASWWKFEIPFIINKLITNQNILNIISTKLYKLDKQFNINKYYDCDDSIINWYIISQRLHLGAINHYKNLKQLIFQLVQSNNFENAINTEIKLYRKTITYKEPEMIKFKIDEYKTVVKRFNYWKINELQWALSNDTETATPAQLILNGIDIKYEIGEEVR